MTTSLWVLFIVAQALNAGNMNYQQDMGYREINPIYGEHPDKGRVYLTKAAEVGLVYGLTKLFPEHEDEILGVASGVTIGMLVYDRGMGIGFKFSW